MTNKKSFPYGGTFRCRLFYTHYNMIYSINCLLTPDSMHQLLYFKIQSHMWQSCVEIEGAYFSRIAVFTCMRFLCFEQTWSFIHK